MLRCTLEIVRQFVLRLVQRHGHLAAVHQRAKQQLVRQRFLQVVLNHARHRTGPHRTVVAFLGQPVAGLLAYFQRHAFLIQLNLQLDDELVHDLMDHLGREVIEPDNVVQTVTELRREDLLDLLHRIGAVILVDQTDGFTLGFTYPGVGGHHQHHVAEVRLAPVVVGQRPVVHHLQQDVEHVRVRFLDFIEQQYRVRMLDHRVGEQAALVKAHVARRRTNQTADGVTLHILGHIKAQQLNAQCFRELNRYLGFPHAGRAGKQEGTDRLVLMPQSCACHLDRFG